MIERVHATSSGTVVNDIAYRRIEVKHGVDRIEGRKIRFTDGTSDEFDILVAATGYLIDLPFLSEESCRAPTTASGSGSG